MSQNSDILKQFEYITHSRVRRGYMYDFEYAHPLLHDPLCKDLYSEFYLRKALEVLQDLNKKKWEKDYFGLLSTNPAITPFSIEKHSDRPWNVHLSLVNRNVTEEYIEKNVEYLESEKCCYFFYYASGTIEMSAKLLKYPECYKRRPLHWDEARGCYEDKLFFLCTAKDIPNLDCGNECFIKKCSDDFVGCMIETDHDFACVYDNQNFTKEFIEKHIDCWDSARILSNANLDETFIMKYEHKWENTQFLSLQYNTSISWEFLKKFFHARGITSSSYFFGSIRAPFDELWNMRFAREIFYNPTITFEQLRLWNERDKIFHLSLLPSWTKPSIFRFPNLTWKDFFDLKAMSVEVDYDAVFSNPMPYQKKLFFDMLQEKASVIQRWWRKHMYRPDSSYVNRVVARRFRDMCSANDCGESQNDAHAHRAEEKIM